MAADDFRIVAREGQGPPPPLQWDVRVPPCVFKEAKKLLRHKEKYVHAVGLVTELARHEDPSHSETLTLDNLRNEEFHEISDKGGPLGKLNLRIYYYIDKEAGDIILLSVQKKEADRATPTSIIQLCRTRLRMYKEARERIKSASVADERGRES